MWIPIVICILCLLIYRYHISTIERKMLTGFWSPDEPFKDSAGVEEMLFWFGNETKKAIEGYLVLVVDGKAAHNDKITMAFTPNMLSSGGTLTLSDDILNIPKKLDAEIDIPSGRLLLSSGGTLYARLYRKNQESLLGVLDTQPDSETLDGKTAASGDAQAT